MRPERIVAAALFALAGALVALVVLGPTEGAGATPESASRSTTAAEPGTKGEPTSTEEALPTEPEVDTTTEAAGTPTSTVKRNAFCGSTPCMGSKSSMG